MIRIYSYSKDSKKMEAPGIVELPRHIADRGRIVWVDLEDPTDEETGVLSGIFGFHTLAVEDCVHDDHLPRADRYEDYTFLVVIAADCDHAEERLGGLEVDVFVGERFLVTYHKGYVRGISEARGHVAKNPGSWLRSPDWLLHGILDGMVDDYAPVLRMLDARINDLEERLLDAPREGHIQEVLSLKRETLCLHRITLAQQEVLGRMARGKLPRISGESLVYYQNIHDHLARISHAADGFRERLGGTMETYLTVVSSRTNRAVCVLAATATIALPLILISGVLGLGAEPMPGIGGANARLIVVGAAVLMLVAGLAIIRKLRWF